MINYEKALSPQPYPLLNCYVTTHLNETAIGKKLAKLPWLPIIILYAGAVKEALFAYASPFINLTCIIILIVYI